MFFSSWADLGRILVVGLLAYVALVFLLRISGKRTLSKMNAFDFVITVALGSTIASTILTGTPLVNGVVALTLLIGLQYVITWLSVRSETFQNLVKSRPTLLFYRGRFLEDAMRRERVTAEEIRAAIRSGGGSETEACSGVVLETDGTMVVLSDLPRSGVHGALANVQGAEEIGSLDPGEERSPVA